MGRTPPPDPHIDILGLYTPEAQGLGGFDRIDRSTELYHLKKKLTTNPATQRSSVAFLIVERRGCRHGRGRCGRGRRRRRGRGKFPKSSTR